MPVFSSHLVTYPDLGLGKRIREVRQRQGLTLQDLAARCGVSAARLSQIENEEHVLDVGQAFAIADGLQIPLESLLPADVRIPYQITREERVHCRPPREGRVVYGDDVRVAQNHFWPLAELFVGRHMEPMLARVMPSAEAELQVCLHHDQEFAFVLKGAVEFIVETPRGRQREELNPGDCIYFRPSLPHALRSLQSEPSETLHAFASGSLPLAAALEWQAADAKDRQQSGLRRQIGTEIAFLRASRGWTHRFVAGVVGLSERSIRQIEDGNRSVPLDTLLAFARALGQPVREFVRNGRPPEPYYVVQRAADIDNIPPRRRRHRLERTGARILFDHLRLAGDFPSRYIHPYLLRVPNVGIESLTTHAHHGQELIYVLDGQIELTTYAERNEVKETLRPGDTCYLDSSVPHLVRGQSRNPYSQTSASVLVVFWCPLGEEYLFDLTAAGEDAATFSRASA